MGRSRGRDHIWNPFAPDTPWHVVLEVHVDNADRLGTAERGMVVFYGGELWQVADLAPLPGERMRFELVRRKRRGER